MPKDRMFQVSPIVPIFITSLLCTTSAGYNMDIYSSEFFNNTLETYCPNASIFSQSVSENIFTGYQYPCCKSCSRHREYGRHRNCCFYGDDLYRYAGSETCISSGFGSTTLGREFYYMVNKCLDPNQDCQHTKASSWGSIYPVYSPNSKRIYFNEHCAICNGEQEVTSFQLIFGCSSMTTALLMSHTDNLARLLVGKNSTECAIMFKPPEGTDLTNYECTSPIIRTCLEGYDNSRLGSNEKMRALCESFNATILFQEENNIKKYGNVFCALCNGETFIVRTCSALPLLGRRDISGLSFHSILSGLGKTNIDVSSYGVSTSKQICRTNDTFYNETMCKPLLCPEGRLWDGETCRVFVDYRGISSYYITVKLTNANQDEHLPVSMLESLEQEERGPSARWLKRAGLQNWDALVFYRARNASVDSVDYLIVMLSFQNRDVNNMNFIHVLDQINVSMATNWEVRIFDETFYFKVKFYNFYFPSVVNEATSDSTGLNMDDASITGFEVEFVKLLSDIPNNIYAGIFITENFFCNQIDLLPFEYKVYMPLIYLHEKNIFLGESQFKIITNDDETFSVRVCRNIWADNSYTVSATSQIFWFQTLLIFAVVALFLNSRNELTP